MNTVHLAIARTRRRIYFDSWLRTLGWLALVWVGLAAGVLLAERLLSLAVPVPQVWVFGVLGGVLFLMAPMIALSRQPNEAASAAMMDDRLGLKDSLGTALYAETLKDDPFARQVLEDADKLASKTRVDDAFKIGLGAGWGYALPAGAVWALMFVFVPSGLDFFGVNQQREEQQQQQAQTEEVQRQILEANALLKEVETNESELTEADPDEVFKELASLSKRDLTNPDFRKETISKLATVQEKLAAAEQAKQQQIKTAKSQMSKLDPGTRGPADRFADALRRGDFEAAQKELQRLTEGFDSMPPGEKEALKQQLENMSDQLEDMAEQQEKAKEEAENQIQQQLQNAGLSQQQINQLQSQGYNQQAVQQAVQQSLQNQGMNQQQAQQQAQQTAQNVQQQQQQSQNAGQCQQQNQGMSQSMNQMAQSLGQPQQQGQQQGQPQGQQQGQQPGQQQGQFSQGAGQVQQQLNQMQQMQNQLNQMQSQQQQMQQAMNQMSQNQGQGQGQGQPSNQGGQGGKKAGTGPGGNPLGQEYQTGPYATRTEQDIQQGQGRVIASWQQDGEMAAGDATVEFDKAITEARTDAERAVTEDRVPRRYHGAVKDYFQQLPDSPDEVRKAPAAPR